jgi:hypothetical protein
MGILCTTVAEAAVNQPFVELPDETFLRGAFVESTYNVNVSVEVAMSRYPSLSFSANKDRLAVFVLFTYDLYPNGTHPRLPSLVCSLNALYANVGRANSLDVYMWMSATELPRLPSWFRDTFPEVMVMPIDPASWVVPRQAGPPESWACYANSTASLNYHLMGRWRQTFAFDFVRAMGYEYMLQIDDDTFVLQPIDFNIVQDFRSRRIAFAHRDRVFVEKGVVTAGLPELVKYWMVTRNYLTPAGPLFENLNTGNISGLGGEGWNRQIVSGNFMLFNVGFWFEPAVQDFLQLVHSTGSDVTMRWQEQAVVNMVRLLFLPAQQVHAFHQHQSLHQKVHDAGVFRLMGCDGVAATAPSEPEERGLRDLGLLSAEAAATVRTIELVILWEVHAIGAEREDFLLFRWRYNVSSCGGDTARLNGYQALHDSLDIYSDMWFEFDMSAKFQGLMAEDGVYDAGQDGTAVSCLDVLSQQLYRYVEFYCIAMSTDEGNRIQQLCNSMLNNAMTAFRAQTSAIPA